MESNWSTASGDNSIKLLLPRLADYHCKQRLPVSTCRHLSKGISRNLVRVETKYCGSGRKLWKNVFGTLKSGWTSKSSDLRWSHGPQPHFQTKARHKLLLSHLPTICMSKGPETWEVKITHFNQRQFIYNCLVTIGRVNSVFANCNHQKLIAGIRNSAHWWDEWFIYFFSELGLRRGAPGIQSISI